jgi:hypothetical protein
VSELPVETTVVEAIGGLRADGFDHDFSVSRSGGVRCGTCGTEHAAAELTLAATVRVEVMSNPDDEAVVFGLRCDHCGIRGVLVAAYGPAASAEEADVVTALLRS